MSSETTGTKGPSGRYALALYDVAHERAALDSVAADMQSLRAMLRESADFRRFVASPIVSRDKQKKGIWALAEKAGFSELTRNVLGLLAMNRRLSFLDDVARSYLARLAEARGEVSVTVHAAKTLSNDQIASLSQTLKQTVGKDVVLNIFVDPAILGGLIVKVGSRMVDNSVRSKLQRLQLAMKGVG